MARLLAALGAGAASSPVASVLLFGAAPPALMMVCVFLRGDHGMARWRDGAMAQLFWCCGCCCPGPGGCRVVGVAINLIKDNSNCKLVSGFAC